MMHDLRARPDTDMELSKIVVLAVDTRAMATGIMHEEPSMQQIIHLVIRPLPSS